MISIIFHTEILVFILFPGSDCIPGGFGTLDELFETLTLIQTKSISKKVPIVLFGREFWERVVDFEFLAEIGMISRSDLELFHIVDSVNDGLDYILPILGKSLNRKNH